MKKNLFVLFVVLVFLIAVAMAFLSRRAPSPVSDSGELGGKVIIFHAGSLSVPFKQISDEFEKKYPHVDIVLEGAGSRQCARKISDLKKRCDVMASADYTVIDALLIPDHADWNIKFAMNEMAIAYHDASRKANEIDADNWHKILMDDSVRFGRSDPNADPCGYRAVLTMKLAEAHYKQPGLAERMMKRHRKYIRPKETDLLALLESNEIDYVFLYRSVAQQHGLKMVLLPDAVNLKKAEQAETYQTVRVQISGKKPGEFIAKKGAPMVYGVTIPKNAENPAAALAFVTFLLEKENGRAIMESNGQPSAVPGKSETYEKIPAALKPFAQPCN